MICPILTYPSISEPHYHRQINCPIEKCAWWDEEEGQCDYKSSRQAQERIADALEKIVKGLNVSVAR